MLLRLTGDVVCGPQSLGDAPTETPKLCAAALIAAERVLIISGLGV